MRLCEVDRRKQFSKAGNIILTKKKEISEQSSALLTLLTARLIYCSGLSFNWIPLSHDGIQGPFY